MYFVYVYENRTLKPVEILLRKGRRRGGRGEGVAVMKTYCKHIWKYHNVSFLYNYYMLIF
jgi:hypothetical protein